MFARCIWLFLVVSAALAGCGNRTHAAPGCQQVGGSCTDDAACCSFGCVNSQCTCNPYPGGICATSNDCCDGFGGASRCTAGACESGCRAVKDVCKSNGQCCGQTCTDGKCVAPPCRNIGQACNENFTCCDGAKCVNGTCADVNCKEATWLQRDRGVLPGDGLSVGCVHHRVSGTVQELRHRQRVLPRPRMPRAHLYLGLSDHLAGLLGGRRLLHRPALQPRRQQRHRQELREGKAGRDLHRLQSMHEPAGVHRWLLPRYPVPQRRLGLRGRRRLLQRAVRRGQAVLPQRYRVLLEQRELLRAGHLPPWLFHSGQEHLRRVPRARRDL